MTDNLELNMNAYLPLRDVVFNTLREAILKGELKPGERLMELQLASKLGGACCNHTEKRSRGCPYDRKGHGRCVTDPGSIR